MSTSRQGRLHRAAFGALLALAVGAFTAQDTSAQGLFNSLFGGFSHNDRESGGWNRRDEWGRGGWGRRDYGEERYQRRSAYAPASPTLDGRFPIPDFSVHPERRSVDAAPRNSGVHCVRLCDGRHFPLPRSAGGAKLDPVKVCSALCPAAKTQVFHGGAMEHAVASDGTRYADLDEAFTYRDKIVPDCSCTGHGPGGLAQIDIESDPTLRAGDVVVTASGPSIFRGS
ncbi:MAG: DUF2865 domain-containing protein, partial [Variibacter sp.]|nr:DUF2865 domain-containing protein [Variibacter sp.]